MGVSSINIIIIIIIIVEHTEVEIASRIWGSNLSRTWRALEVFLMVIISQ